MTSPARFEVHIASTREGVSRMVTTSIPRSPTTIWSRCTQELTVGSNVSPAYPQYPENIKGNIRLLL